MKPTDLSRVSPHEQELGGWISPDGLFFQAEYCQHDRVAEEIVGSFLCVSYEMYRGSSWLVKNGWIRLETSGYINHGFQATEQQANVLYWCYTRAVFRSYKEELYAKIAQIVANLYVPEPMPRVPSQGDQENFRSLYAR